MADITYRVNLKSTDIPMLSELFGRSVIVKGPDQNYIPGLAAKESIDSAAGVPQVYYCHNVLPTDSGYKSVGYQQVVIPAYPTDAKLNSVLSLRDGNGNFALFCSDTAGNTFILRAGETAWVLPYGGPPVTAIQNKRVTVAFVSGVTYIYWAGVGCYYYDWAIDRFVQVTLTGLVETDIIGIVGNRGYLIAYSETAVAWSSTTSATDFTPSLETGAGGGQVEAARGKIVTIESVYGGMIAFTDSNAVAITAQDNERYPYMFSEITGAGGLEDPAFVTYDANSAAIYAYTTSGLQTINVRQAATVHPAVTDFLSGGLFEDFNEITDEFVLTELQGSVLQKRLVIVADRYLIISYGINTLTHAIVYDMSLKQFGRLKHTHTDCFEFIRAGVENPKKCIAFLSGTGEVNILDTDIISDTSSGVAILGKYQYVRTRTLQLQGVEVENVNQGDNFSLYDLPSSEGKTFDSPVVGYLARSVGKQRKYLFHNTALNHTLLLKGAFNLVSLLLTFNVGGSR